jgi:hypothetical protein
MRSICYDCYYSLQLRPIYSPLVVVVVAARILRTCAVASLCYSYSCDSSREGGRTEEALSRYPDRRESHGGDTRPETAVYTRILN